MLVIIHNRLVSKSTNHSVIMISSWFLGNAFLLLKEVQLTMLSVFSYLMSVNLLYKESLDACKMFTVTISIYFSDFFFVSVALYFFYLYNSRHLHTHFFLLCFYYRLLCSDVSNLFWCLNSIPLTISFIVSRPSGKLSLSSLKKRCDERAIEQGGLWDGLGRIWYNPSRTHSICWRSDFILSLLQGFPSR